MLEYFYHKITRKVIVGFGTLFNDIYVSRNDTEGNEIERIKVPIAYGPKQKYIIRESNSNPDLVRNFSMDLPRMGYEFVSLEYDSTKQMPVSQKSAFIDSETNYLKYRYERVPYRIMLDLHIVTKNTDDGLQILEQILPYFSPDFNITLLSVGADAKIDVPIYIEKIEKQEDYEEDFSTFKNLIFTIRFVAKVNLYGPVTRSKVITQSEVNFYDQYDIDALVVGATGATALSLIFSVTGGATAGSLTAGSIYEQRIDYGEL
jgi:hypothetical protein